MQRNFQLEAEAKAAFTALCKSGGDALDDLCRWEARYSGFTPEAFESTDRKDRGKVQSDRKTEARNLIYGNDRKGTRKGGFVGRGRVINNKPYRRLCVGFEKVPGLKHLAFDPAVQFDAEKLALVTAEMGKQFDAGSCFFVEWGDEGKGNHINILTTQGRGLIVPDDELAGWVGYISKPPPFVTSLAVAYIVAKRASGARALPSRRFGIGCSPRARPVPLAAIEDVLGTVPTKRKRLVKGPVQEKTVIAADPEQIAAARLPLLQGVTPEGFALITRLHDVWATGAYDRMPFAHGPARMPDLGFTLGTYFRRSTLRPGETYDLEAYAVALGLGVTDCAPEIKDSQTFVRRSCIRRVVAASKNISVRRPS